MKEMEASGLVNIQPHSKTHANLTLRLAGETDAKYRDRMRAEVDTPIRLIQDRLAVAERRVRLSVRRRQRDGGRLC